MNLISDEQRSRLVARNRQAWNRRKKLDPYRAEVIEMYNLGVPYKAIAAELGVSGGTVWRYLELLKQEGGIKRN